MLGRANVVLAGGTESMSRVPYFAEGARWGMRDWETRSWSMACTAMALTIHCLDW